MGSSTLLGRIRIYSFVCLIFFYHFSLNRFGLCQYFMLFREEEIDMLDVDPNDKPQRILCYHPESDCLFVVNSMAEYINYCKDDPIDDVTGVEWAEKDYIERENEEKGEDLES